MSTDRRMDKDVVHIYDRLGTIKDNKIMPFAVMWMYIETDILTEVKSDRERQLLHDIAYMWNLLKMVQINFLTKHK